MHWEQKVQYAKLSDIGFRRRNNQDACVVQTCSDQKSWEERGHLFMVADGMGGHAAGELASKIAVDTAPHTFFKLKDLSAPVALKRAIEAANAAIYERGMQNLDFQRMGTTCTALVLTPEGALIGHVGDSRIYRVRDDRIDQLSFDHSLQWELLRQGHMSPEQIFLHEPRHVITRSLGPEETVEVDIEGPYPIFPGDRYVLCSDGLTGHLSDSEIGAIVNELPAGDACRLLVNLANLRGGSDNITVVVVRVGELSRAAAQVEKVEPPEEEPGLSWWWLAVFWAIAATFVTGISLGLLGKWTVGLTLATTALAAVVGLLVFWWLTRPPSLPLRDPSATVLWKTYRTASAQFSHKLLGHLASLESELQRTALEEGWSIDWTAHEEAFKAAKAAIEQSQFSQAMLEFAKAIDALMAGLQQQRKQFDRNSKWGKGPPSRVGREVTSDE